MKGKKSVLAVTMTKGYSHSGSLHVISLNSDDHHHVLTEDIGDKKTDLPNISKQVRDEVRIPTHMC